MNGLIPANDSWPRFLNNFPFIADGMLMSRRQFKSQAALFAQLVLLIALGLAMSRFQHGASLILTIVALAGFAVLVGIRLVSWANQSRLAPFSTLGEGRPASGPEPSSRTSAQGHPSSTARGSLASGPASSVKPIDRVRALDWFQFEKLTAVLFAECGFEVQRSGGANPDGGIDLIVSLDRKASGVQCKHWKVWKVGVKEIREFVGALKDCGLERGIFVTLQHYTSDARALAGRHQIELAGEMEITRMLEAARCEQNPKLLAILNDTRKVCPKCEAEMVLRTAGSGKTKGQKFWGCAKFPRCRFTQPAG